jgi:hypothetical protein
LGQFKTREIENASDFFIFLIDKFSSLLYTKQDAASSTKISILNRKNKKCRNRLERVQNIEAINLFCYKENS